MESVIAEELDCNQVDITTEEKMLVIRVSEQVVATILGTSQCLDGILIQFKIDAMSRDKHFTNLSK